LAWSHVVQGRVSRYKKIKAFDPFSKTRGHVDLFKGKHYDMAPSAKDMEAYSRVKRELPSANRKPETDSKAKPQRMFGVRVITFKHNCCRTD
jgi:hypothetical protein